ncbi:uncharacterized protein Triagg1_3729 [Trichoderma aggressivum f. europaeum]|uniref:4-hydroxy-3-methoxy-5-polyprenylbenzoate decarboxylase n=1 Tax=Trichoderma aggressivum f. europaeum TaxID=173218 RepID=A0AAE1M0X9_9HYPO|nr:hypothetical protein Triagg1_3729 [Trichoderma aggressivum f. europaeum]
MGHIVKAPRILRLKLQGAGETLEGELGGVRDERHRDRGSAGAPKADGFRDRFVCLVSSPFNLASTYGNGSAIGESPVWAPSSGFELALGLDSAGPGILAVTSTNNNNTNNTIVTLTTCNLPLLDGHETGRKSHGAQLLCTQPASAQVSRACALDQDRASRHGARIWHHVAAESLPCCMPCYAVPSLTSPIFLPPPSPADLIATLGEATATPYFIYRLRDAMLAHPTGRRILRLRPRISSKTLSIPALRALPENSVGRAYVSWLDREGVSPDTRSLVRYIDDEECAYVMQRYRECHDFYHALTGLPTVREGEVALKAFEFANTLIPMTGLSMLAVATLKPAERRRFFSVYMPWAVKNGVRSKEIINVFWEEELERDVDDLRRELGIERPPDLREIRKREKEEKKRLKEMRAHGF